MKMETFIVIFIVIVGFGLLSSLIGNSGPSGKSRHGSGSDSGFIGSSHYPHSSDHRDRDYDSDDRHHRSDDWGGDNDSGSSDNGGGFGGDSGGSSGGDGGGGD